MNHPAPEISPEGASPDTTDAPPTGEAATPNASAGEDCVDRPHPIWWILVLGGLTLLVFQAFHDGLYQWWTANLHPLPSQKVWQWVCYGCIPIHVFEAVYAYRLAHRIDIRRHFWRLCNNGNVYITKTVTLCFNFTVDIT